MDNTITDALALQLTSNLELSLDLLTKAGAPFPAAKPAILGGLGAVIRMARTPLVESPPQAVARADVNRALAKAAKLLDAYRLSCLRDRFELECSRPKDAESAALYAQLENELKWNLEKVSRLLASMAVFRERKPKILQSFPNWYYHANELFTWYKLAFEGGSSSKHGPCNRFICLALLRDPVRSGSTVERALNTYDRLLEERPL